MFSNLLCPHSSSNFSLPKSFKLSKFSYTSEIFDAKTRMKLRKKDNFLYLRLSWYSRHCIGIIYMNETSIWNIVTNKYLVLKRNGSTELFIDIITNYKFGL